MIHLQNFLARSPSLPAGATWQDTKVSQPLNSTEHEVQNLPEMVARTG